MRIICCIIALHVLFVCRGQQLSYRTFDKVHGMPTNTVYDIIQDRLGYVWLGTDKGLFRFDGDEYKLYTSSKQDGKSISNLLEDRFGRIWGQNFSGQFFYTQADSLTFCKELKPTGNYCPAAILHQTYLMSIGEKGVRSLDLATFHSKESVLTLDATLYASVDKTNYYLYENDNHFIITTNYQGKQTLIPTNLKTNVDYFFVVRVKDVFYLAPKTDANHILVMSNGKVIDKIALGRTNLIQNVKQLDDHTLAFFTASGLYLIDTRNRKATPIPILTDKNTSSILKDHEGNYWVSTINSGVLFIPSFSVKILESSSGYSRLVTQESENTLFLGTTQSEIFKLNPYTNTKTLIHKSNINTEIFSMYYQPQRKALLFCSDNFYCYQKGKTHIITKMAVKDIEQLNSNQFVTAATGSVSVFNWQTLDRHIMNVFTGNIRGRAVAIDSTSGIHYAATSLGLWQFNRDATLKEIKDKGNSLSILDLAIRQGPVSEIYAASATGGIYFIKQGKIVKHLTKANGLEDDAIYRLKLYKNQLWWLTEKAIQSYDLVKGQVRTYSKADGLPESDLKDIALMNDQVYVATLAGLITFPISLPSKGSIVPKLYLNRLMVNQQEYASANQALQFAYDQNDVDINFSVLSFKNIGDLKVVYQINNQTWQTLGKNQRTLNLPSLSPDTYRINIKAIDSEGLTSKVLTVVFVIEKPFWTTFWFIGLLILFIGYIAYTIVQKNLERVQKAAALEAEKLTLEKNLQASMLTALKAQMNPHFMFNALNSIQEQFMYGDKVKANEQMGNFTYLTRQILTVSGKKKINLSTEIEILTKYLELEKMRFAEGFTYQISLSETIDEDYHQIPPMLIQPFVENSIKHGLLHKQGDKKIDIAFDLDEQEENIICVVQDNGVGRKKSAEIKSKRVQQHESFSTSATEERLRLLNNDLQNQNLIVYEDLVNNNDEVLGTKVTLTIALG